MQLQFSTYIHKHEIELISLSVLQRQSFKRPADLTLQELFV